MHSKYHFKEVTYGVELTEILEIHFLELRKLQDKDKDLLNLWLQFINSSSQEVSQMISLKDEDIKKAYEVLEQLNRDPQIREAYEAREKWERDYISRLAAAEDKGREKGIRLTAVNLLKDNIDIGIISKATGLTIVEIKQMKIEN